ncbi:MAG: hypothetical protein GX121_02860 [Ignavibacteria bacterium]|nr:hypothetical protein [Ignavibacteria bacterium]
MKKVIFAALSVAIMLVFDAFSATTFVSPGGGWRMSNGCNSLPGYASDLHTRGTTVIFKCTGRTGTCYIVNGAYLTVNTNMNLQLEEDEITVDMIAEPVVIE